MKVINMKTLKYALTLTSILFLGCGDGSNSNTPNPFAITAYPLSEIKIVAGMKKDILLTSNRSDVTYQIIEKSEAPNAELDKDTLILRADSTASGIRHVTVKALDSTNNKDTTLIITFNIISEPTTITTKVLKTGSDDCLAGLARTFNLNDDDDIVDPLGNIWAAGSDNAQLATKSYLGATTKCEILKLTNKGTNWRVPTKDELLNLINYSKNPNTNMIEDIFGDDTINNTWAQPENGTNLVVSQNNALIAHIDTYNFQKYPVRCINPLLEDVSHVISTDRGTGYTKDFSTRLIWSPITERKKLIDNNASEYCANLGWRLPSINELRSVSENGMISSFIRGTNTILPSSTLYNDSNSSAREAYYSLFIQESIATTGISYADISYGITCVKEF